MAREFRQEKSELHAQWKLHSNYQVKAMLVHLMRSSFLLVKASNMNSVKKRGEWR